MLRNPFKRKDKGPPPVSFAPPPPALEPGRGRFMEGWKAYPVTGRRRSGTEVARPFWAKAAKAVGGEDALIAAIQRYAASRDATKEGGMYVPGFHRWLRNGSAANWIEGAE